MPRLPVVTEDPIDCLGVPDQQSPYRSGPQFHGRPGVAPVRIEESQCSGCHPQFVRGHQVIPAILSAHGSRRSISAATSERVLASDSAANTSASTTLTGV